MAYKHVSIAAEAAEVAAEAEAVSATPWTVQQEQREADRLEIGISSIRQYRCNNLFFTNLSAEIPDLEATSALRSPKVVPSSSPISLAEEEPSPHEIFKLRGIGLETELLKYFVSWAASVCLLR